LCIAVFANSLGGDFVSDDISGYVENSNVHIMAEAWKNLEFGQIIKVLKHKYSPIYLTYSLFFAAFGANEVPLHILSVLIHAAVACIAFIFVSMLFDKRIGIIAALLFTVHPVNSEAVDWISALKYLVVAGVIFVTTILYTMYKNTRDKKFLIYSFIFFTASLIGTKFMWLVVTPPLLFIIDQFFIEKKINFKSMLALIPNSIPIGLFAILFLARKYSERVVNLEVKYNFNRAETAPLPARTVYTIYNTIKLFIYPKNLALYHEGESLNKMIFAFMTLVALAFIVGIFVAWKKNRKVAGLMLFILVSIAPTFSPDQVAWLIAERYLYIASIAFCVLAAMGFIALEKKTKINNLTVYLLVTALTIYSIRTVVRNTEWATRQTVWESTQRVSPNSPRVYNNLGDVYGKQGDYERSIKMFETAIIVDPQYAEATHNLGNTYARLGDFDKAEEQFRKAYELKPSQYQSIHMIGVIELERGNFEEAKRLFEEVVRIDPSYSPSQQGLLLVTQAMQQGGAPVNQGTETPQE